jgi:hypothetical protein
MKLEIKPFTDRPLVDDLLTNVDTYVVVPLHWTSDKAIAIDFWPVEMLRYKDIMFAAITHNLTIKVDGSRDQGKTFPFTVIQETVLTAGAAPTRVDISSYGHFDALQISVKPSVGGAHGTLSTWLFGSTESGYGSMLT